MATITSTANAAGDAGIGTTGNHQGTLRHAIHFAGQNAFAFGVSSISDRVRL